MQITQFKVFCFSVLPLFIRKCIKKQFSEVIVCCSHWFHDHISVTTTLLKQNLVTFSINHLQFHTLWQLFNNSIYANNNCHQMRQFLHLKRIIKRDETYSFRGFTINFPMPRNCNEAIAISEYCLVNSLIAIQITTTFCQALIQQQVLLHY